MVTLRDIAAKAAVSQTTVSKVLNNKYREVGITSDCATRVRAIADQLGYRPNRAARATASGRFNTIGILKISGPIGLGELPDGLLNGIERQADRLGLQLSFSSVPANFEARKRLPKVLRESWTDGFVLVGDWHPEAAAELADMVRGMGLPLVSLGLRGEHDGISADEAGGCRQAVQCLLGAGHRRIGYVPDEHLATAVRKERIASFNEVMQGAGLTGEVVRLPAERRHVEVWPWEENAQARQEFLKSTDRPSALVIDSVALAYPLLSEARHLGVRIPEQLAMVTFHDVAASALGICINTFLLRCGEMGARSVDLLQSRIDQGEPVDSVSVQYEYIGGHTI